MDVSVRGATAVGPRVPIHAHVVSTLRFLSPGHFSFCPGLVPTWTRTHVSAPLSARGLWVDVFGLSACRSTWIHKPRVRGSTAACVLSVCPLSDQGHRPISPCRQLCAHILVS